jgi:hypothetical protein
MVTINPPISHTTISTTDWGIPVTNQVNANTTAIASDASKIATNTADISAMKPTPWTNLVLQNGFTQYASGQVCQYRKIGDIVYIRGACNMPTLSATTTLTTLPVGFRPITSLEFFALYWDWPTSTRKLQAISVNPNGAVAAIDASANVIMNINSLIFSTLA